MADEKKDAGGRKLHMDLIYLLGGLFLLSAFISRIERTFWDESYSLTVVYLRIAYSYAISYILPALLLLSAIVTVLCVWGIYRVLALSSALAEEEHEIYGAKVELPEDASPREKNGRWERVIELINSANSSDWRLAIIEADVMLEDLLQRMGYHGETIGEMLKSVEESDFLTLDAAWEAHKIRNKIAHSGSEFNLNEREAKRVVALFESVFREFKII